MLYDMRNIFEDLKPPDGIPPSGLREEVFTSLRTMQLIADVIDLFTSQFILSESDMVNLFDSNFHDAPHSPEDDRDKDSEDGEKENPENDEPEKK